MAELYYIRHCEPNYDNHVDALRELTPKGQADTGLVTAYLRDKGIDMVLSSPFKRAVDTVGPFAKGAGLAVATMDGLRERRVDSGWIEDFEGFTRRQWADFSYKLSDGESLGEVQEPWGVHFSFAGRQCLRVEEVDLFTGVIKEIC